jgi:hypothetical protein
MKTSPNAANPKTTPTSSEKTPPTHRIAATTPKAVQIRLYVFGDIYNLRNYLLMQGSFYAPQDLFARVVPIQKCFFTVFARENVWNCSQGRDVYCGNVH